MKGPGRSMTMRSSSWAFITKSVKFSMPEKSYTPGSGSWLDHSMYLRKEVMVIQSTLILQGGGGWKLVLRTSVDLMFRTWAKAGESRKNICEKTIIVLAIKGKGKSLTPSRAMMGDN